MPEGASSWTWGVFPETWGFQPVCSLSSCTWEVQLHDCLCMKGWSTAQSHLRRGTLGPSVLFGEPERGVGCSLVARGVDACACTVCVSTSGVCPCSRRGLFQLGECTLWVSSAGRSPLNATGTEVNHTAPGEQLVALQWWDQAVSRGAQLRQGFCFEIASQARNHSILVAEAPVG